MTKSWNLEANIKKQTPSYGKRNEQTADQITSSKLGNLINFHETMRKYYAAPGFEFLLEGMKKKL